MKTTTLATAVLFASAAAALACPNTGLETNYDSYQATGSDLAGVVGFELEAGGDTPIHSCGNFRSGTDKVEGYFTDAPDFNFDLSGMERYGLAIATASECDSALLVNTGEGDWYYDDDGNPESEGDALITIVEVPNGRVDVWVGTFDGQVCNAELALAAFSR